MIKSPLELIAFAAETLGDLCDEVVFLGGAVVGLLTTDPAALTPRSTNDVDVVVEVSTRADYYILDERLRSKGFTNDTRGPTCRYLHGWIVVDVMPTNADILGFANRWYPLAFETAESHTLDSGATINLISAPCFLATKLDAFNDPDREGHGDLFTSRDFGDVVSVIDGRPEVVAEVEDSRSELRAYLRESFARILDENYLHAAVTEHVDREREDLVLDRMRSLAGA
jgi:hypothetical protein